MFGNLYPDQVSDSAYSVDYEAFYEKGYRGIIFDIDNTLVEHGAPSDERSEALMEHLKEIGFSTCFLSNNQYERVASFNDKIQTNFIENAHKPSKGGYNKAMEQMRTDVSNTLCVGDQILTDVWGANRAGLYTILVKQIGKKEEFQIVLKRILEKIILFFYQRKQRKG